ncbi:hypothetical protein [Amycolatopsis sp. NPDC051061]|uniref:hypothetical protein n=1 Tax=Amycolatopsis sp. NPDC051061 TaxID=3155042 RepID=UPI003427ED1B
MELDESRSEDYWAALRLARRWSHGTLRQAERLRTELNRASRAYEARKTPEFLTSDLLDIEDILDAAWIEQHLLMVAAHQFDKWATRMLEARGDISPKENDLHRLVRNSLEHLDEAVLADKEALPGPTGNSSLRRLPDSRLPLGVTVGEDKVMICDLVEVDEIEKRCIDLAEEIFDEEFDIDAAVDNYRDMQRGL